MLLIILSFLIIVVVFYIYYQNTLKKIKTIEGFSHDYDYDASHNEYLVQSNKYYDNNLNPVLDGLEDVTGFVNVVNKNNNYVVEEKKYSKPTYNEDTEKFKVEIDNCKELNNSDICPSSDMTNCGFCNSDGKFYYEDGSGNIHFDYAGKKDYIPCAPGDWIGKEHTDASKNDHCNRQKEQKICSDATQMCFHVGHSDKVKKTCGWCPGDGKLYPKTEDGEIKYKVSTYPGRTFGNSCNYLNTVSGEYVKDKIQNLTDISCQSFAEQNPCLMDKLNNKPMGERCIEDLWENSQQNHKRKDNYVTIFNNLNHVTDICNNNLPGIQGRSINNIDQVRKMQRKEGSSSFSFQEKVFNFFRNIFTVSDGILDESKNNLQYGIFGGYGKAGIGSENIDNSFNPCADIYNDDPTSLDCMKQIAKDKNCYKPEGYVYQFLNKNYKMTGRDQKKDPNTAYINKEFWGMDNWKKQSRGKVEDELKKYDTNIKMDEKLKFKNYSTYKQAVVMCGRESFVSSMKDHSDLSDNYKPCWDDFKNMVLSLKNDDTGSYDSYFFTGRPYVKFPKDSSLNTVMGLDYYAEDYYAEDYNKDSYIIYKDVYENPNFPHWDFFHIISTHWTKKRFKEMLVNSNDFTQKGDKFTRKTIFGIFNQGRGEEINITSYKNTNFNEWFPKYFGYIKVYWVDK